MSIQELRAFLATHGHLPGIPSASEFEARGSINLAEMDFRLLEKVEEQALYILELESRISELEGQVASLQAEGTAVSVNISPPQETRPENHDLEAEPGSIASLTQRLAEVERLLEKLAADPTSK